MDLTEIVATFTLSATLDRAVMLSMSAPMRKTSMLYTGRSLCNQIENYAHPDEL